MPLYKVLSDINCGKYKPGDVAEFSEQEAAQMPHAVELVVEAEAEIMPEQASSEPKKKRGKK